MNKTQIMEEIYRLELALASIAEKEALDEQQTEDPVTSQSKSQAFDLDVEGTSFEPDRDSDLTERIKEKSNTYLEDETLSEQIKKILVDIDQQFEQLPGKAVLGLFSAGILFGRIVR